MEYRAVFRHCTCWQKVKESHRTEELS